MIYNRSMELNLNKDKKYGLAVSGGVDSMVMMELAYRQGLDCIVLTVDHNLRPESGSDADFVEKQASSRGYETVRASVDVEGYSDETGESTELAGRHLRYEFFEKTARERGLDYVLLAHHLGDQAETVLMRICRGTGVAGLKGIENRSIYIRPLLGYSKEEIRRFAKENRIEFREDSTNEDTLYKRNFFRNKILPELKKEYPDLDKSISRLVDSAVETEDYLRSILIPYTLADDEVALSEEVFTVHRAIGKRSVLEAIKALGVYKDVEVKTYKSIFSLESRGSNTEIDIGQGLVARRSYDGLIIAKKRPVDVYEKPFSVTETYEFGGVKYTFERSSELVKGMTLDVAKVPHGAVVRTRREGDTFRRYKGRRKSLSDYLTDAKVPRSSRDRLLVLSIDNEILMILGMEISDSVKIDDGSEERYVLRLK